VVCMRRRVKGQVVACVRDYLRDAPVDNAYRTALVAALGQRGNILSQEPDFRWALPVTVCCVAAGSAEEQAVPGAAAMEVLMVALDVLDDLEDGEANPLALEFGLPAALNACTGLLLLGQLILLQADAGADLARIWCGSGLCAVTGQHQDLTRCAGEGVGYRDATEITAAKSGSLLSCACRLGAAAARASEEMQFRYAQFGRLLGVTMQLANDVKAVVHGGQDKTDFALRRPVLSMVYTVESARLDSADPSGAPESWGAGSAEFVWAVADTCRRQALRLIPDLAADESSRQALGGLLDVL